MTPRCLTLAHAVVSRALVLALALALLAGACASRRPANPSPQPDGQTAGGPAASQVSSWQREVAHGESTLPQAGPGRDVLLAQLARTCFLVADLSPRNQRQPYLDKGRYFAELLLKEQPHRVEGYYWSSLNLCGTAEMCGAGRALNMLADIVHRLERAAAIDPSYDQAGPHRVLGRIFFLAPPWPLSVGDAHKALQHLQAAAQIAPNNSTNQLFLGETLLHLGKKEEAQRALRAVLTCTDHAVWPQGVQQDREKAENLLRKLHEPGLSRKNPL